MSTNAGSRHRPSGTAALTPTARARSSTSARADRPARRRAVRRQALRARRCGAPARAPGPAGRVPDRRPGRPRPGWGPPRAAVAAPPRPAAPPPVRAAHRRPRPSASSGGWPDRSASASRPTTCGRSRRAWSRSGGPRRLGALDRPARSRPPRPARRPARPRRRGRLPPRHRRAAPTADASAGASRDRAGLRHCDRRRERRRTGHRAGRRRSSRRQCAARPGRSRAAVHVARQRLDPPQPGQAEGQAGREAEPAQRGAGAGSRPGRRRRPTPSASAATGSRATSRAVARAEASSPSTTRRVARASTQLPSHAVDGVGQPLPGAVRDVPGRGEQPEVSAPGWAATARSAAGTSDPTRNASATGASTGQSSAARARAAPGG